MPTRRALGIAKATVPRARLAKSRMPPPDLRTPAPPSGFDTLRFRPDGDSGESSLLESLPSSWTL